MALVLGTSSGFVTTAPTADPNGGATRVVDGASIVTKDTSPAGARKITEIGWYRNTGTNTSNFEIALYSEASGVADAKLYVDATNSSSASGWVTTAVDWPINPSTAYWLGLQMDAHTGDSATDAESSGGAGIDVRLTQTTLNNPYGGGAVADADGMYSIYALVQVVPTTVLNSPADASSDSDTTPTLDFTGTDLNADSVTYETQIDTANTFDSQGAANATFSDNFDDNSLSGSWTATGNTALIFERSERIEIYHDTTATYNQIITGSAYDMDESNFFVRIVDVGNQSLTSHGANFFIRKNADDANKIFFTISGGQISCFKIVVGVQTQVGSNVAYDAAVHKWFRFRETGGSLYWDYATDANGSWTNITSFVNAFGTTSFNIGLQSGAYSVEASGSYTFFDNLSTSKTALINVISSSDTGFVNPDTGGDTDPFNSGENIQYTVQGGSALTAGVYYWRVRASDPGGSKGPGSWATTRSFTITSGGAIKDLISSGFIAFVR